MHSDAAPKLTFDRGTIVVRSSATFDPSGLPGVVWDHRIGGWRAPAHRLREIRSQLDGLPLSAPAVAAPGSASSRWRPIDLRPYQKTALAAWAMNGHRGIVVLPTGAGKTRVALAAAALRNVRTLCLVPTRVLLGQWVAQIRAVYDGDVGIYGDGDRVLKDITVATYASAWRHMGEIGQRFDTLIVDEAHHFGDAAQDEILEMSTAPWRLGLTATPSNDPAVLERASELIGPIVHSQKISDLSGTFLADFESYVWLLPLAPNERAAYDRDMQAFHRFSRLVKERILNPSWVDILREAKKSPQGQAAMAGYRRARALVALTEGKTQALVELLCRHHARSKVLIFTADTTTAYRLSRYLLVPALTADIKRAERDRVIDSFRKGDLPIVVSCRVLNEGVDVPDADVAVILGGTAGDREHVQRVGRVLRPSEGKVAAVYELVADDTFEVRQANRRREALGEPRCS
jgi:superfamily II DNA or RNA helicase